FVNRIRTASGPSPVAPDAQAELAHLQVERREVGGIEQSGDLGDVARRQAHLRPPKMFITWASALSFFSATGAASLADHTVSGRLCSRNRLPLSSIAHSISCGRP